MHWSEATEFEHISAAVARIKRRVEAAYYKCDEDGACAAHDELVSAEHRLRMCQRAEKKRA